jgi:hypothetical protein
MWSTACAAVLGLASAASGQPLVTQWDGTRVDPCGFGIVPGQERFVWAFRNDPGVDPSLRNVVIADWGDIERNTKFDELGVRLVTFLTDSDATPGVIEGSSVKVRIYDNDDGFGDTRRLQIIELTSGALPADTNGGAGTFFDVALPLPSSGELGDDGGVPNLGIRNPGAFADLDGDGLHDFGYEIEVTVPAGVSGDGVGVVLVGPDLTGGLPLVTDPAGMTDLYDERLPGGSFLGTFSFGGASCGSGPTAAEGTVPFGQVYLAVRVQPCNIADLARPFGVLSFGDIAAFNQLFFAGDLRVDFAAPFGVLTFGDVGAFLAAFNGGCP